MTYATKQDLIDRFGESELIELSDRAEPPTGEVDDDVVAKALSDADDTINSYIAKRYELPLASTPSRLVKIAVDLARYDLHLNRRPEGVEKDRDEAIAFLKDVSAGRAVLDVAGAEPAPAGATVLIDAPDREFTRDTMKGF